MQFLTILLTISTIVVVVDADEISAPAASPFIQFPCESGEPLAIWVATTIELIPAGSYIINPQTGQPYINPDGSLYRWYPPATAANPPNTGPGAPLYSSGCRSSLQSCKGEEDEGLRGVDDGKREERLSVRIVEATSEVKVSTSFHITFSILQYNALVNSSAVALNIKKLGVVVQIHAPESPSINVIMVEMPFVTCSGCSKTFL